MSIKRGLMLATILGITGIGNLGTVANAAIYVEENGNTYVTDWNNYEYDAGFEGCLTLKDLNGNDLTFAKQTTGEWVSPLLTVNGSEHSGYYLTYFTFEFNSNKVKVYDYETGKEITNGFLQDGQKVYIISEEDPTNLTVKISPLLIAEN